MMPLPRTRAWLFLGVAIASIVAVGAETTADAAGTAPQPPPPKAAPATLPGDQGKPADPQATLTRADAERIYAKGWQIAEEAKKESAAGKADAAKKKFGKALKKFDEATQVDATYYQAWNMVGFCARKSGDLKRAFEAYRKCLEIEPEYAEAHEYLGEAYLVSGDFAKARAELAWLRSRGSDEAEELAEKIEAMDKAGAAAAKKATAEKAASEKVATEKAEPEKAASDKATPEKAAAAPVSETEKPEGK